MPSGTHHLQRAVMRSSDQWPATPPHHNYTSISCPWISKTGLVKQHSPGRGQHPPGTKLSCSRKRGSNLMLTISWLYNIIYNNIYNIMKISIYYITLFILYIILYRFRALWVRKWQQPLSPPCSGSLWTSGSERWLAVMTKHQAKFAEKLTFVLSVFPPFQRSMTPAHMRAIPQSLAQCVRWGTRCERPWWRKWTAVAGEGCLCAGGTCCTLQDQPTMVLEQERGSRRARGSLWARGAGRDGPLAGGKPWKTCIRGKKSTLLDSGQLCLATVKFAKIIDRWMNMVYLHLDIDNVNN